MPITHLSAYLSNPSYSYLWFFNVLFHLSIGYLYLTVRLGMVRGCKVVNDEIPYE